MKVGGDIGEQREAEGQKAGGKKIKNNGKLPPNKLK